MKFRITITELTAALDALAPDHEIKRYEQTVDELDTRAVIAAVMHRPRKPRVAKVSKPA